MTLSLPALVMAAGIALAFTSPVSAHQETAGNLKIGHPWIREAKAGAPGTYGCIIEIKNDGDEPEMLLGASADGAGKGVIYEIVEKDGKFTSRPVKSGLVIKPHGSIELTPSTYQIRFKNITKDLTADTMVDGTLVFEKLHTVPVHFMIEQDDTAPKEEPEPAVRKSRATLA